MEAFLSEVLEYVVEYAILLFEFVGVAIMICAGVRGIIGCVTRNPLTRLDLARGMAMGLEFKLGGEILRTVVVHEWSDMLLVGGIIILRAALTLLIHWEIHELEKKDVEVPADRSVLFSHKKKGEEQESEVATEENNDTETK